MIKMIITLGLGFFVICCFASFTEMYVKDHSREKKENQRAEQIAQLLQEKKMAELNATPPYLREAYVQAANDITSLVLKNYKTEKWDYVEKCYNPWILEREWFKIMYWIDDAPFFCFVIMEDLKVVSLSSEEPKEDLEEISFESEKESVPFAAKWFDDNSVKISKLTNKYKVNTTIPWTMLPDKTETQKIDDICEYLVCEVGFARARVVEKGVKVSVDKV